MVNALDRKEVIWTCLCHGSFRTDLAVLMLSENYMSAVFRKFIVAFFSGRENFIYNSSYYRSSKENSLELPRNFVSTSLRESSFIVTQHLKWKKDNLQADKIK